MNTAQEHALGKTIYCNSRTKCVIVKCRILCRRTGDPALKKKRILLLSEGFGAGHTRAAHALSVSLRQHSPNVQTKVLELGTFLHPTIMPIIYHAYRKTLTSSPRLYAMLYQKQNKMLSRFSQLALHRLFYAQTAEVIRQLRPDTIVCTHPFPNAVVSRLKRSGLNIPLCTVITDYDAHGTWISPETYMYLVSTPEVKNKLLLKGVPQERIQVTGIPVHPSFLTRHDRNAVLRKYRLKNMPTVLVMGGGWGIGPKDICEHLASWREQIQLIFCLGNNEKAIAKMSAEPLYRHEHIRLLGFTNEVDKLMDVSDLLITKPGGLTCTEAMAKGVPMLLYDAIPGQEEENCQYFIENGFAEKIDHIGVIDRWMDRLLHHHDELKSRRQSIANNVAQFGPAGWTRAILQTVNEA
mgnify:FL=1